MGLFDRFRQKGKHPSVIESWPTRAYRKIEEWAQEGTVFSADDLRFYVGDPETPHQMGAVLSRARRNGIIIVRATEVSTRPERKGARISVFAAAA